MEQPVDVSALRRPLNGRDRDSTDALLTIGEFARRSRLSLKALRLYERRGVLHPDQVDPNTGYRRYRESQLSTARLVAMLRRLDMPLTQVAEVLAARGPAAAAVLDAYWAEVERRTASNRELAAHLRSRLIGADTPSTDFGPVRCRDVPAQPVLTRQQRILAPELSGWLNTTMAELGHKATGPMFVIYHGEVTQDSDGPVEVCVPVRRSHTVQPAHREAFVRLRKAQVAYPQILSAFDAVVAWIDARGLKVAGSPREVYFADFQAAASGDEVCDVAYPID
jgi:DNA-binding transcriptional MerR regulator